MVSPVRQIRQIVDALGDRVQKEGKERVAVTGTLNRGGVVSGLQIISEMPGLLRIEEQGGRGKTLVYDSITGLVVVK